MTDPRLRHLQVPVVGGSLHVGVWEPEGEASATILAIHGVTSSHLAWAWLAEAMPGVRIVAPDLRGRGRSQGLAGGGGMATHADDVAAVIDALALGPATIVGHSMGGFVAVVTASMHPEVVAGLLLLDGGVPFGVPQGLSPEEAVQAVLGPTADRLRMRFGDEAAYLDFWRAHPAFADTWDARLEEYLRYDLVRCEGDLAPATSYATTVADTVDLMTGSDVPDALRSLAVPATFITVPLGLTAAPPGLYSPERLASLPVEAPTLVHRRLADFNHYTLVMSTAGASAVAGLVEEALAASRAQKEG
ncbi:alpha/beta hydrolase [Demequina sp. NBRC 110052]|uniref:alpha/beta hydrolase n=1 Tax=Demequina sp. NBRC 110052 TaxID=1570341 RepID=UPI000A05D612|nr:alpha/beta hydrolase [Demequina sp. NBRC 110052]